MELEEKSTLTADLFSVPLISNPKATDAQLIRASHAAVLGWSAIMGVSSNKAFFPEKERRRVVTSKLIMSSPFPFPFSDLGHHLLLHRDLDGIPL